MKKQILLGLFLLTIFCVVPNFAQSDSISNEELVTELVRLKNVPEDRVSREIDKRFVIFRKLIDSVKIYLTPKGAIEIDARSRTLIITDTTSNIEFMKGVVTAYDYEEIYLPSNEEDKQVVCSGFVPRF
jgi:type II secretory pathway component GspD/PulD (secretin)